MKIFSRIFARISSAKVAVELGIIIVGVLIALAADGWRQGLVDRAAELSYRQRILEDLNTGEDQLNSGIARFEQVTADLDFLIEAELSSSSDDELTQRFTGAAAYGGSQDRYDHDDTYEELVSSGNLSIIESAELRDSLGTYYAFVNGELKKGFEEVPRTLLYDFGKLTGYFPIDTDMGNGLPSESRARIVNFLRNDLDSNYKDSLRLVRATVVRHIGSARVGLSINTRITERLNVSIDADLAQ